MPIIIPEKLPAAEILSEENIFFMTEPRALSQDIRPLKLIILNLMPTKIITEIQLCRVLSNTPLHMELEWLHLDSHVSKNTSQEHLIAFYKTFDEIKSKKYDGMIITGAPVEQLPFEEVDYWQQLTEVMDWAKHNVFSTFFICWAAQAGLYHYFGIPKYQLTEKKFGVFPHSINKKGVNLFRGFDDEFFVPHSRHTEVRKEDILKVPELEVMSESPQSGVYIIKTKNGRQIFVTGHSEYDPLTLKSEYDRDIDKGLTISVPENYYPDNDPTKEPIVRWRSHANLLYSNWLNYYVYQETPYNLDNI